MSLFAESVFRAATLDGNRIAVCQLFVQSA